MPEIAQPSFAAGEVTPAMHARVDMARYYIGLATCRNFIVKPTGGVQNRSGTYFVASTKDITKTSRLVEFRFSASQAYVLEFGYHYIRVYWRGDLVDEVVTTYTEADLRALDFTQSNDVMTICHSDYPQQQLGRYAHDDWRIGPFLNVNGPFGDMNIIEANTVYSSAVVGNVTLTAATDIFASNMIGQLFRIEQHPENSTKNWEVAAAITINDIRKTSTGYYQALNSGTTGTVRPDHTEGTGYDGNPGVAWQFLHNGSGIVQLTGYTSAKIMTGTVTTRLPDSVITATYAKTITAAVPMDPDGTPASGDEYVLVTCAAHSFVSGDPVTISGVVGMTDINGVFTITVVDANSFKVSIETSQSYVSGGTATKTLGAKPTYKWSLESWGGDQGYPATSSYYQQRQIFGGTPGRPQAVQMSKSGGFLDYGTSVPTLDDDALNFSLNSGSIGQILHFVGLKQLIALTTEGPWMIAKELGNPIPLTDPQGEGGAASVRPIKINKQALYVEDKGSAIRSLGYEFSSDTYEGKDLTITADHLFEGHAVVEWAYQKVPNHVVWMVRDDGVLLGLTYMVEQEVVAWHRHDTDGFYESVCVVSEDTEDAVYFVVRRTINGVTQRYLEKMSPRIVATEDDAFHVDCGLTYDGRGTVTISAVAIDLTAVVWHLSGATEWLYTETLTFTANANLFVGSGDVNDVLIATAADGSLLRLKISEYVSATVAKVQPSRTVPVELRGAVTGIQFARDTFGGLSHLEGKEVAILADNKVSPRATVTGGIVSIPNAATVVHIGLPYVCDVETLEVTEQGRSSQDRVKNINSVSVMVRESRGILAGPNADNLLETRTEITTRFDSLYRQSVGNVSINILSDWSKGARVFIRQEDPLPVTILSIIPTVTVSGS